jgi:DNA-binding MarR family transcriptional regulator
MPDGTPQSQTVIVVDPAVDPLVAFQLALHRVLKSLVFRSHPNSPLIEMPISQLRCLHVVAEQEGQKMLDISHRLEVKLPALSQIVDRLVKRGMVERHPDASDRRVVRLGLTDEARSIMKEAEAGRNARLQATVNELSEANLTQVTGALALLADAAEKIEALERAEAPPFSPFTPESETLAEIISDRSRPDRHSTETPVSPRAAGSRQ